MKNRQQLISTAAILLLSASPAMAADSDAVDFAQEAKTCVAAVNDHADYNDATRVRHNVVEMKHLFAGYVLEIHTEVFSDTDEAAVRQYDSYCFAKDDNKPRKFEIEKVSG